MNWIDCVLLAIVGLSVLVSLMRGFVKEALSLSTWVLALWVAISFSEPLSLVLKNQIAVPGVRSFVSFIILFVATVFIGSIVNFIIGKIIRKTPFSGADRIIGSIFGLARGALVCSVLVFVVGLSDLVADPSWHESKLLPMVKVMSDKIAHYLPESIQFPAGQEKNKLENNKLENNKLEKKIEDNLKKNLEKKLENKTGRKSDSPSSSSTSLEEKLKVLKMFEENSKAFEETSKKISKNINQLPKG